MDIKKIAYWILTLLMCALFLFSAQMYFFNTAGIKGAFTSFNFPTWLVIPLAIAKVLGVIAVLSNQNKLLTEWAYAGFFFDVILATAAHYFAGDGLIGPSFIGVFLVLGSRLMWQFRQSR